MLKKRIFSFALLLAAVLPATSAAAEQEKSRISGPLPGKSLYDVEHDRRLRLRERPYGTQYQFFERRYYTGPQKYHTDDDRPKYYLDHNYSNWGNY